MRYSAIVPAFNAEATIGETVESILAQTVPAAEIVIVDDGSTDKTAELAQRMSPLVRVVRQENAGAGRATTLGFHQVASPVLATLDADDLWLPDKMQRQLAHLEADHGCSGVFTHIRLFRGNVTDAIETRPGWSRSTLVFRTQAARRVGDVIDPPDGGRGDMVDWLARARHIGLRLTMLDDVLALRRVHPGSWSYGRDSKLDKGYARVAWLALQRRKGDVGVMAPPPRRRGFPHYSWAWPSGDLDQLLRAVLTPDDATAVQLARAWLARHDINDSSFAQQRLLLALVERLGRQLEDEPAYPRLVGLQKKLWSRSRLALRDVREALGALADKAIDMLLIKGASRLAVDPGAARGRASHDVDIVIRPDDAPAAFSVLIEAGWEPATGSGPLRVKARAAVYRALNFLKGRYGDVDVHQSAYHSAQADAADEERLWADSLPARLDGIAVRVPSPADRIALAIAHSAFDAHVHSDWMVDIAQVVRSGEVDWDQLLRTLVARRILVPAASSLTYLADAGCPIPQDRLAALVRLADAQGLAARLQLIECKPRDDLGGFSAFSAAS